MAEDLAREIIAQSGSGSKLAFSFRFVAVTRFSTHPEMQMKRYSIMYINAVAMMTNDIMNSSMRIWKVLWT